MRTWVVTGPAGAGKSTVTALLAARGAAVVDGDRLGHEVLARPEVQARLAARFGEDVVGPGQVDREKLGTLVFADPAALADLNAITHGPLAELARERLAGLAAAGSHELAVFEAAVYFLLPSPPAAETVIAVTAPADLRAQRLVDRAGGALDLAAARSRIAAQAALEPLWARADHVLVNDGTPQDLAAAVDALHRRLTTGSENRP